MDYVGKQVLKGTVSRKKKSDNIYAQGRGWTKGAEASPPPPYQGQSWEKC